MPIAFDARIGRDARRIGSHVRLHDALVEVVTEVEHVVIDAKLIGNASRVVDIGDRATSAVGISTPQLHRHAGHGKTLLEQQRAATDEVDAARHRDEHLRDARSSPHHPKRRRRATAAGSHRARGRRRQQSTSSRA
jgi:hypothetical protein